METLTATFRIVTPMFIGGADQSPDDGVRPPSVKGALRFWWRALNWGKFYDPKKKDEAEALKALHDEEVRLFGGSAEQGGQGIFLLEVARQPSSNAIVSDWPINPTGAGYMAYGIIESKGGKSGRLHLHREGIQESQDFIVRLCFRPRIFQEDKDSISAALDAWNLFGGLGSRSRRGMGSVTRLLDPQGKLLTRQEYEQQANQVITNMSSVSVPPYTAMSKESRFRILSSEGSNARAVLNQAGQKYRSFRGQASALRGKAKIPFGLPLEGVDVKNRRASPLLFHVHALANGKFVASVLYLPASLFHPHPNYSAISMDKVAEFAQGGNR